MISSVAVTPFDAVLAAILIMAVGYGLWKGFVRMALGVAGLVVTVTFALRLAGHGPEWFRGVLGSERLAEAGAFLVVLLVGLLVTGVVVYLAHRLVGAAQIGWLDRLAGGIVGGAGAAIVLAALFVTLSVFVPQFAPASRGSLLAPSLWRVADLAAQVLPPSMAAEYRALRRSAGSPAPSAPVGEKGKRS